MKTKEDTRFKHSRLFLDLDISCIESEKPRCSIAADSPQQEPDVGMQCSLDGAELLIEQKLAAAAIAGGYAEGEVRRGGFDSASATP